MGIRQQRHLLYLNVAPADGLCLGVELRPMARGKETGQEGDNGFLGIAGR